MSANLPEMENTQLKPLRDLRRKKMQFVFDDYSMGHTKLPPGYWSRGCVQTETEWDVRRARSTMIRVLLLRALPRRLAGLHFVAF